MISNKAKYSLIVMLIIFLFSYHSYIFSNIWLITLDPSNFIPAESNIFFFHPTQIDDGSGGYWRYAEDLKYFYYFSEVQDHTYYLHEKKNHCPDFNQTDIKTWCQSIKRIRIDASH